MKEWQLFYKVRQIMRNVDHPLMIEAINKYLEGLKDLNVKPAQLNQSFVAQDYLRDILPQIKKQAESCLYTGYKPNKGTTKQQEMVNKNSGYMIEILSVLEQY